ncbi:hypothetical protein EDC96DRAFT_531589 [Choanephora cucurbitarum]|nr:hypothetical protein EDC96DRAFT_531589 [Choanephora cucurbitarum]
MPTHLSNLLEGKTLTGVLPPEKQPPVQNLLPQYNQPALLDIESCVDSPFLGLHLKEPSKRRKSVKHHSGQVHIKRKQKIVTTTNTNNQHADNTGGGHGLVMLRRRDLEADQLGEELDHLFLPTSNSYLKPTFSLTQYNSLVELDISRNQLSRLPHQICHLTQLRVLNMTSNQLSEIPIELYALHALEVLILSQNQIQVIPEDMPERLPNLITLRLAANRINQLPEKLEHWQRMRHLQLGSVFGGNQLIRLPDGITQMSALEELDVSYNQLKSLPHDLAIDSLQILNVSHNQLDFIPKSITQCRQLKSLNVSKNHLTTLPADLVQLNRLELLDISENLLCIMPAEILEQMQSTNLLITGNPLTRPGHCDLSNQDPYSRILRQMTQYGVARSPASSPKVARISLREQCGPKGMGCLTPSSDQSSASSSSSFSDSQFINQSTLSSSTPSYFPPVTLPSFSSLPPPSPPPSSSLSLPPPMIFEESKAESVNSFTSAPHPQHDEDASIDHELSYHAQQLNIDGSRPVHDTYDLIGTSRSRIVQDSTQSKCILIDFPRESPLPIETGLLLSLREIASRTILKHKMDIPLIYLPRHLVQDLKAGRTCANCQDPFVNEWVTSVQVKSFGGHPAVVRRVRFCSTQCWTQCLPTKVRSKSVICVHQQ